MARNIEFTNYKQISELTHNGIVYATLKQIVEELSKEKIKKTIPTFEKAIKAYDIDGVRIGKAVLYNKEKAITMLTWEFDPKSRMKMFNLLTEQKK